VTSAGANVPEVPEHHPAVDTVLFTDVSFTAVVWDDRSYRVHTLGPLSSAIWMEIDGSTTATSIAELLVELRLVEPSGAASAMAATLAEFWALGLLTGSPPRPRTAPACAID
jgi:hypothetical protein